MKKIISLTAMVLLLVAVYPVSANDWYCYTLEGESVMVLSAEDSKGASDRLYVNGLKPDWKQYNWGDVDLITDLKIQHNEYTGKYRLRVKGGVDNIWYTRIDNIATEEEADEIYNSLFHAIHSWKDECPPTLHIKIDATDTGKPKFIINGMELTDAYPYLECSLVGSSNCIKFLKIYCDRK